VCNCYLDVIARSGQLRSATGTTPGRSRNSLAGWGRKGSVPHVLTTSSIAAGNGGGYARYLEGTDRHIMSNKT